MRTVWYIFIIMLILPSLLLSADMLTAKGNGLGETIVLSSSTASEQLKLPNLSLTDKNILVEIGLNRKFDIKDLDQVYLVSAYRRHSFSVAAGFSQFGYRDLYAERTFMLSGAFHIKNMVTASISLSYLQYDFGGYYEQLSSTGIDIGAVYSGQRFFAGFLVENVNSPQLDDNSLKYDPRLNLYSELIGIGKFSLTGRITMQKDETVQFGLGQTITVSPKATFFWGFSTAPTIFGGGFDITLNKTGIGYAASYHPVLGLSHTVTLAYIFGKVKKQEGFE